MNQTSPVKLRLSVFLLTFVLLGTARTWALSPPANNSQNDNSQNDNSQNVSSASVSQQDMTHFLTLRKQVFSKDPDLKAEHRELVKEWRQLGNASPDDRQAFLQRLIAHQEKIKQAMVQIEPSFGSAIDRIHQRARQKVEQATQSGGT